MKILSWNVRGLGNPRTVKRLKNKLRAVNPRILFLIETKLSVKKMELVRMKCGFENGIDVGAIETYGNPIERDSGASWKLLRHLSNYCSLPWVVIGDFNEILKSHEKRGGRLRSERQMLDFRMALEDCNLFDLGFIGRWFTWERGRFQATNIRERLDRGVASPTWMDIFPNHKIEHLTHSFSDHCPILLDTMNDGCFDFQRKARLFRFEAKWCLDSSFEGLVDRYWAESSGSIPKRLENIGINFMKWSKVKSRETTRNRFRLEQRLNELHAQDISDEVLAEIVEAQLDLNLEADKEELQWEQRARVNWLRDGDRNTSFFHKMASLRHYRNKIPELVDAHGIKRSEPAEMIKVATDFFEDLFTASEMGSDDHLFSLVEKKVTASMNDYLLKDFTDEDVWNAVNSMSPLKAPGVDGYSAIFFPTILAYCGPISLCTVIYKIIAKMLVSRMSDILGVCINEAQGAFIPGRLTSDNVLIAYEVLHSLKMKKSGKKGNFALKLDMSKAYDRVEWDFLAGMMKALGFHVDWIILIMRCVSSVSYSVCLNGLESDWFSPSRGLRQGDPLSPYLFIICAEGFSTLLEDAKHRGCMGATTIGKERLAINHLFFADDCILFGDASRDGAMSVRDIIREYEQCAGKKVNYEKRRNWAFAEFLDRFRKRVDGWSFRYLSMGAKAGSYPSFTWRSICSARDLIVDGLLWRIGTGECVNIWNDPWLPGRITTEYQQLINGDTKTWNRELIDNLVDEYTADRILAIPLTAHRTEDTLVWKYEGTGVYTIKSGYRVLTTSNVLPNSTSASLSITSEATEGWQKDFYTSLWPLHVLEKIKIHIWRLFNNLVPHYGNLERRKLMMNPVCPLCSDAIEDSNHLMWSCGVLKSVWIQLHVQVPTFEESWSGQKCFATIFSAADENVRCVLAISIWSLWYRRNKLIHEGVRFNLIEVLGFIQDPFVAEARAYERALILALDMDSRRVVVEGDSLSVIKSIKKREEDRSILRPITQNICQLETRFDEISYLHVRRSANGVAHHLAKEGRRLGIFGRWEVGVPESVKRLALQEELEMNQD
ncbi:reverse transcriptase [Gossypium australe]|uniref:Reverse transcriptase n=1 Tax=Gossypium australe TaxID=47621 RepID=A0A5B6W9Y0_9ROSI|nr:reverse transcriptase [Gossypium australe]